MGRLLKWIFVFVVICFVALVIYTYIGPYFGVSFDPVRTLTQEPVILNES